MRILGCLAVLSFLVVTAGCGAGGPPAAKLYSVSGKVTVAGKPIADCNIQFVAVGKEGYFGGKIGADGTYTLVAPDGRSGAEVGKYKVVLQQAPEAAMKAMQAGGMGPPGSGGPGGGGSNLPFPAEYSSVETSQKEVEVKAESNTINIEIP